jgi:hypothetical protein
MRPAFRLRISTGCPTLPWIEMFDWLSGVLPCDVCCTPC